MELTYKSSKTGREQPVAPPVDAEDLYQRYLQLRAERDMSRNTTEGANQLVTESTKANSGNTLS